MIDVRHLRTLRVIAETGSLTAAAVRLHLTQSALSHQIKEIEARLGLPVLIRRSRPVSLTRAGRTLSTLAGELLPRLDETLAGLKRMAHGQAGRLHIASECHNCLDWLLPRLRILRDRFPEVELDVVLSASLDPLPRLLAGEVDLVLSPDRRALGGIVWAPLFAYELRLVMHRGHRLCARPDALPEDFQGETLLVYPVERARLDVFTRFLWPAGVEPARIRTVESSIMLLELAALGQGVSVLPDWICRPAEQAGRVHSARIGAQGLSGALFAALREGESQLPIMQGFLELARQTGPAFVVSSHP